MDVCVCVGCIYACVEQMMVWVCGGNLVLRGWGSGKRLCRGEESPAIQLPMPPDTHTYAFTHIHTHTYTHTHATMHMYKYTQAQIYQMYQHAHIHAYIHKYIHTKT